MPGCPVRANTDRMRRSKVRLFDHLVGAGKQRRRHGQSKRLRRFEIDHQFVLGWRLHRQVSRLLALEDAIDVACCARN